MFFALALSFLFVGAFSIPKAEAKVIPWRTYFDKNSFTGKQTNYSYFNKTVASNVFVSYSQHIKVGSGWNYDRILVQFHHYTKR